MQRSAPIFLAADSVGVGSLAPGHAETMNLRPELVRQCMPSRWYWQLGKLDRGGQRPGLAPNCSHRPTSSRDPRIDFLRGFALITIFIDHVPANPLNLLTMRNFGFADAAELFVILAGVSSMMAYGKCFEREGTRSGLWRIAARCFRVYAFQIALLLATLAIVYEWRLHLGLQLVQLSPFFDSPLRVIAQALTLRAQPASLNILPLYVVLLALFPLIYTGIHYFRGLTMTVSAAVWLVANLRSDFNFTNWLDGQGWFFNPFAWQFLFTLGVLGAIVLRSNGGELPRMRPLIIASWAYLGVALVLAAPWTSWGISDARLMDFAPLDKTDLSSFRLINIIALVYLALSSPRLRRFATQPWVTHVVSCGKHSLEVFSLSTLIALLFRLLFRTYGPCWWLEILVNLIGVGSMLLLARMLEHCCSDVDKRRRGHWYYRAAIPLRQVAGGA
jgi:hypothetical protein